ncbi:hypothetical protein BU15DRAFT_82636 [Melanogaster broomeanus]|nr:hypothetical protein BU15DRAFT_82636 [Melanogaster broomeanus]
MLAISCVAAQRNRSTSRKRGHDDRQGVPGSSMGVYSAVFSSPQSIGGKSSPLPSICPPRPCPPWKQLSSKREALVLWSSSSMCSPYYTGTLACPSPYVYGMIIVLWRPQVATSARQALESMPPPSFEHGAIVLPRDHALERIPHGSGHNMATSMPLNVLNVVWLLDLYSEARRLV